MDVPAGVVLHGALAASSSSLLESSLLELSALGFAFLADGPFRLGAFRFLDSGDLGMITGLTSQNIMLDCAKADRMPMDLFIYFFRGGGGRTNKQVISTFWSGPRVRKGQQNSKTNPAF